MDNLLSKLQKFVDLNPKTVVVIANDRYTTYFTVVDCIISTKLNENNKKVVQEILSSDNVAVRLQQWGENLLTPEKKFILRNNELFTEEALKSKENEQEQEIRGVKRRFSEYSSL